MNTGRLRAGKGGGEEGSECSDCASEGRCRSRQNYRWREGARVRDTHERFGHRGDILEHQKVWEEDVEARQWKVMDCEWNEMSMS